MNRLPIEKQIQVVSALVGGNSIRATVRMTGVAKNTISKLLVELGAACSEYMDKTLVNLPCQRVQVDERRRRASLNHVGASLRYHHVEDCQQSSWSRFLEFSSPSEIACSN
jgi:hypothetical protein